MLSQDESLPFACQEIVREEPFRTPVEVIRAFSDGSSLLSNSSFWFQCARIPQSFSLGVQMFKLRIEYF